jgi:uncharacterized YceG family protein
VSDRTPEEREAARLEREARRSGQPFQRELTEPPPAEQGVPHAVEPPAPAIQWPPPAVVPPPPDRPRAPDPPAAPPPRAPDPPPAPPPAPDPPAAPPPPLARRTRAKRPVRRPGERSRVRRPRSIVARIVAVVTLLLAIAGIWFLVELFQPFNGAGDGSVVVTIPTGAATDTIGTELAHDGVVSSSFFFGLRATLAGDRGKLLAGRYRLKRGMGYGAVLTILTTPPKAAPTTNVTVIPGRTRRQIAVLLHEQGVHGRYLTSTRHTTLLNLRAYGAPRNLDNLEGFLFPSTYQLREPISIPALVADQLTTFREQFATVNMRYARSKNLTPYDVLKIASMVEAEAGTAHDRPLIASVIYNRLRFGMPLGIDATVRYAVNNYTSPLTASQLNSPSPYNTRTHTGLPPTPIDNPSLASIEAAAHPARTTYLYFVAKPCGNGASAFASTNAQFQIDVQRYDQARARRGGRSPLVCRK